MTISKIADRLKVGTAMAAEVAGVCVFASILYLIFCRCLFVKTSISVSIESSTDNDVRVLNSVVQAV